MMNLLPGLQSSTDALSAEKLRMDLIAQNIANAQTTRDADGDVYRRKMVSFEAYLLDHNKLATSSEGLRGVRVSGVEEDLSPGVRVFNPQHPHADGDGMVTMPNVQLAREMVDLISSSRAYEANLAAVKTSRQMAQNALSIGR